MKWSSYLWSCRISTLEPSLSRISRDITNCSLGYVTSLLPADTATGARDHFGTLPRLNECTSTRLVLKERTGRWGSRQLVMSVWNWVAITDFIAAKLVGILFLRLVHESVSVPHIPGNNWESAMYLWRHATVWPHHGNTHSAPQRYLST
jgi:hypothetical protein